MSVKKPRKPLTVYFVLYRSMFDHELLFSKQVPGEFYSRVGAKRALENAKIDPAKNWCMAKTYKIMKFKSVE